MEFRIEKPVTIITPSIANETLLECIDSVNNQTYSNLKHLVVFDGKDALEKSLKLNVSDHYTKLQTTVSPENTGKNNGDFWGHRIYAGYSHLINSDYVFFLDEDNFYEPNHVETLINLIEKQNLDWAYSLRNIISKEGEFIVEDCCESLGKWPIFWSLNKEHQYLIDTSSYCFKRDFLIHVSHHWHFGWGADRRFFQILTKMLHHTNFNTTGLHTLNYRLDDNIEKKYGSVDFFKNGNKEVLKYYGGYPWKI